MFIYDEVVDVKCYLYFFFRNERGKGKIRYCIFCIEKLSKIESILVFISDYRSFIEVN